MDKIALSRMGVSASGSRSGSAPAANTHIGHTAFPAADRLPGAGLGTDFGHSTRPSREDLRQRLLMIREQLDDRDTREQRLRDRVSRWLRAVPVKRLAAWWPIRHEPDLRGVLAAWLAEEPGRVVSLPVIHGNLLEFAPWTPGDVMTRGPFGIAVPATRARVLPHLLLIPCVGIDRSRYRLGYGGGYYDRTIPKLAAKPVMVGVAFDCGRIESIQPQPHDVRMDLAITESGVW